MSELNYEVDTQEAGTVQVTGDCIEKIMKALDISKEDLRTEQENENS